MCLYISRDSWLLQTFVHENERRLVRLNIVMNKNKTRQLKTNELELEIPVKQVGTQSSSPLLCTHNVNNRVIFFPFS